MILKKGVYLIMEKKYKFETVEEYREYLRKNSQKWYANNKEKKLEYQRKYYYNQKQKKKDEAINI